MIRSAETARISRLRNGLSEPTPPKTSEPMLIATAIRTTIESGFIHGETSFDISRPTAPIPTTISAVPPAAWATAAGSNET